MDAQHAQSKLRLVGEEPDPAAGDVAREMRRAALLATGDARWALACRAASSLERGPGGRCAVLPPERRRKLIESAKKMGMREFDANLVIAIVQDGARSGEGALGSMVASRVSMVNSTRDAHGDRERSGASVAGLVLTSVGLGLGSAALVVYLLWGG